MIHIIKLSLKEQIQSFKKSILQLPEIPFAGILSTECLQSFVEKSSCKRQRIFTPLVTLKAFISQVLSADGSCRQAVSQVLLERVSAGEKANSVNTSAYCKARENMPLAPLIQMVKETGKALHDQSHPSWRWKGHNTLLVDGFTALMPDTISNQSAFPQQRNQKAGLGFPIVRTVGLISLSAGTVVSYAQGPYQGKGTGETSLLSQLFDDISPNDILLADRYYCTWAILVLLIAQGSHILVQNHARRKPDFRKGERLGAKDHIVEWKKPKKSRSGWPKRITWPYRKKSAYGNLPWAAESMSRHSWITKNTQKKPWESCTKHVGSLSWIFAVSKRTWGWRCCAANQRTG